MCLSQQIDPNIYSCQLSRALVIVSLCIVECDSFKYNYDVYSTSKRCLLSYRQPHWGKYQLQKCQIDRHVFRIFGEYPEIFGVLVR